MFKLKVQHKYLTVDAVQYYIGSSRQACIEQAIHTADLSSYVWSWEN